MAKTKTAYVCASCGTKVARWLGRCPGCNEWNTFSEEIIGHKPSTGFSAGILTPESVPVSLDKVAEEGSPRLDFTFDTEMNRVLGGGMVGGSTVLVGGAPGIGKSTLLLQLALRYHQPVLYVSGEESASQIKLRALRINPDLRNCFVLSETNVTKIIRHAQKMDPSFIIIDSIQTLFHDELDSATGTVSQIRLTAATLQDFAKQSAIPIFIIGHITKEGILAGPKLLEHMVDVVLHFEGDNKYVYRVLRTVKNRFGSTDEIGIYEMRSDGLRPVSNPSELLLSQATSPMSGSAVAATIEGIRPILVETQALVSKAVYGNPQRNATGFDNKRLGMLLAVLEKKCGLFFSQQDVYLNIAGGIRIIDPAADLAIAAALISSLYDMALGSDIAFAGEISLSGEIRAVSRIEQRIQEARRMGFTKIFVSSYNQKTELSNKNELAVIQIQRIEEMLEILFKT